jgi:SH3-like domain-containing protein
LSGRRTAVVAPNQANNLIPLYESPDAKAGEVAKLQPGVMGSIKSCDGQWCLFAGKNFSGYVQQDRLWGAYPKEKVD